mgnify:CR=1 FL=1
MHRENENRVRICSFFSFFSFFFLFFFLVAEIHIFFCTVFACLRDALFFPMALFFFVTFTLFFVSLFHFRLLFFFFLLFLLRFTIKSRLSFDCGPPRIAIPIRRKSRTTIHSDPSITTTIIMIVIDNYVSNDRLC